MTGPHAADVEAQLRARKVDAVHRITVPMMIVNLTNAAAFLLVLWWTQQLSPTALGWAILVAALAFQSLAGAYRSRHRAPPRRASPRATRRVVVNSLIFGLCWAIPGVTFAPGLSGFAEVFAYALLTGMIAGGAFGLYPIPGAAMAYLIPVIAGSLAGLAWEHGPLALGPTIVAATFLFMFRRVIRRHADLFVSEFVGRIELEKRNRLIEDLLEEARVDALGTRQMIEERLARSEKMDAIGQLTGGIAHNFNNLLTAIQGHAELLESDGRSDRTLVEPILSGCRAGARQVQRLLSIAGKQILRPEPVPLTSLVAGLIRMVEPSLGPQFRLRPAIAADAPPPFADPAQLEAALLNLIFNARDAMPDGGDITLICRNAEGEDAEGMVEIAVRDSGIGMDAVTRDRATDPFFTTKPLGEATGLGLSSVAGFARQSRGEMSILSSPGEGTTVTLRLPATRARPAPESGPRVTETGEGSATVLVVEDMADVRKVTGEMLKSLGYRVIAVGSPDEALSVISGNAEIDVVLTDILLSDEVTGLQLAKSIRKLRPEIPTVFVSGWARTGGETAEGSGSRVLPKPFTRKQLAEHIRHALTGPPVTAHP